MSEERIPVKIVALEPDPDSFLIIDGRRYAGVNASVTEETFRAMLAGYVCCLCYERQSKPFPEVCEAPWGCPMEIRDKQREMIERIYQGERWIGPTLSNADELERMDEESLRKRLDQKIYIPPKGPR